MNRKFLCILLSMALLCLMLTCCATDGMDSHQETVPTNDEESVQTAPTNAVGGVFENEMERDGVHDPTEEPAEVTEPENEVEEVESISTMPTTEIVEVESTSVMPTESEKTESTTEAIITTQPAEPETEPQIQEGSIGGSEETDRDA